MTKYTFEMYHQITSQTTIEAKSYKEAELLLLAGDCEWEEVSSEGGDWELVSQSLPKSEINPTPLIERLKTAYDRNRYAWFVIDGQGNTMHEGLDELTAREYSMKDDSYSIGFAHTMPMKDDTGIKINDSGVPITYENKDELTAEDIESAGADK